MESLEATLDAQQRAKSKKDAETAAWKEALAMVTARDRPEKPEGALWSDFIRSIVTSEPEFMPAALENADMDYNDMMIFLTGHISMLQKTAKKLIGSIDRSKAKRERMSKTVTKKESKCAKLVEEVFTNPDAVEEKLEEARQALTWN